MGEMIGTHKWGDFVIRTAAAVVGFGTLSMGQRTAARADMGLVGASPSRMRRMGRRPALLTRMGRSVVRNGYETASKLPLLSPAGGSLVPTVTLPRTVASSKFAATDVSCNYPYVNLQ